MSESILQAIAIAAELTGTELSRAAAQVMGKDLAMYPEAQVLGSLTRCRRECKGRLTLADVISRLDDGRPGPEEAWAKLPRDESVTSIWTGEAREAYGVAAPLIAEGDMIAARMAFLESYRGIVARARDAGVPTKWHVSLGHDKSGREGVIRDAVERRLISADMARNLLPDKEAIARIEKRAEKALTHDETRQAMQKKPQI